VLDGGSLDAAETETALIDRDGGAEDTWVPHDGPLDEDSGVRNDASPPDGPRSFVTVTFNVGLHPKEGQGLTKEQIDYLDRYYGNGLAWGPAIEEARLFLESVQPAIVTFQEIFPVETCASIPAEARTGFVCETWTPGSPSVPEMVLGSLYQVACHSGKPDKCAAVKKSFGSFAGCAANVCYDGLYGSKIDGCGSGARVGRGVILRLDGSELTLVSVHGTSGESSDATDCRKKQVEQVFVNLGDGAPAANGAVSLVQGDFNTDPRNALALLLDPSARRWADFVGEGKPFFFVNPAEASYPADTPLLTIDNVVSNSLRGECWYPGVTSGRPAVSPEGYFDHTPTVCEILLTESQP